MASGSQSNPDYKELQRNNLLSSLYTQALRKSAFHIDRFAMFLILNANDVSFVYYPIVEIFKHIF